MKTIGIREDTLKKLDVFGDGLSRNKAIRKLVENAPDVDTVEYTRNYPNVGIDDDLFLKLKKCKKYSNESHSDVIDRLLDEYQDD